MSNARKPPPTVEVVDPIIVRAIKWKRGVGSVDLSYCFRDPEGNTTTGSRFGVDSSLVVADYLADDLLTGFLALAEPRSVTRALRTLAEDPKQKPVVLRSGLLASLLQYGIAPVETWTFLLNHGAARRKGMALLNRSGSPEVRTVDPWAAAGKKYELLDRTIMHCSEAARSLRRLQSVDMSAALVALGYAKSFDLGASENQKLRPITRCEPIRIGPLPAWPPELTKGLTAELEHLAINLKKYLPFVKPPRHRVANPDGPRFCRDWYNLAKHHAKNPLYAYGAPLYSLLFQKVTEGSFTELCRRARKATELTKKD